MDMVLGIQLQLGLPTFDKVSRQEWIIPINTELKKRKFTAGSH